MELEPLGDVCVSFSPPLEKGFFIRRYKRFLADVQLEDGRVAAVHCPNSGSMKGCLEKGAPVRLTPAPAGSRRKTSYTWEMIQINGGWVGINTNMPNQLAALAAQRHALPVFREAVDVRREVAAGRHSRMDLLVETTRGLLWVEAKNVTLVEDGTALFPDAVTTRGAKHLDVLVEKVREGHRGAMFYVVQRQDARRFAPAASIDPVYAERFQWALSQGVEVVVVQARVTPERICLAGLLPMA
ncbi:sugar fermentation stimulation protein A [Desulfacinum hydrothermale DSM 13146]|uniref:Sugar fermentation stimulation protein homolog n=1 Tax=Desulfacinum hydrothermale DSM 13146 TaxID=1121390 RepID=A0A1W1WX68_9BACT|nr:DNA/RNA nuclease SfsA [Desulfacinum hydrothermale]SMC16197.1 sugar fermentation stimulation protein A [Desulfacinum hydrothermale DSM 13146]